MIIKTRMLTKYYQFKNNTPLFSKHGKEPKTFCMKTFALSLNVSSTPDIAERSKLLPVLSADGLRIKNLRLFVEKC